MTDLSAVESLFLAAVDFSIRAESFRFQTEAKRWTEAEAELAALKKLRPRDPQVHLEAFRAFAANGRWDRATGEHSTAIRLKPGDLTSVLERYRYHAERDEAAQAQAAYVEATKVRAKDIPFRLKCADVCAGFKQWAKARAEYATVLEAGILGDGELNRTAWLRLTVLQLYFGDVHAYRRTCVQLVERHGNDTDVRMLDLLVRLCLLHPDPGLAPARVAELANRVAREGSHPDTQLHIQAIASLRAGKNDVDVAALQQARNKYLWDTRRIALARVFHDQGDYRRARDALNAVSASTRNVDLTTGSTGRWDFNLEAQLWFRQAEAVIQSERWKAVDALVKQRQWAAAIDALGPLLKPEDTFAGDWGTRATCFAELGRWQEAVPDSAHANALSPDYLPGVFKHGLVCLQVGDRDQYRELCRRALARQADSTDRLVLNSVAWLCALDAAAEKEAVQALALVEKALDKAPNNNVRHTRACLLYRATRYDDALKQLTELIAQPGYSVNTYDWLFLAMTHQRLGQPARARKYLDQSIVWMAANNHLDWQKRTELERFRAEAEVLTGMKR